MTANTSTELPASVQVYDWVRNAIVNGRLVPDERYSIYWLADEVGFSRTPVREAILRLAQLGVIDIERNRGFLVRRLDIEEVRSNYEARLLLEVPGARAAATYGDRAFADGLYAQVERIDEDLLQGNTLAHLDRDRALHAEILSLGQNSRAVHFASTLRDASVQTWDLFNQNTAEGRARNHDQHHAIIDAIAAGDAEAAGRAMQRHLESTALTLMQHVATQADLPIPEKFTGRLRPYPDQA